MKSSRKGSFFSSSSTTVTFAFHNDDHSTSPTHHGVTEIPIQSSKAAPVPVTVHLPHQFQSNAAAKIQSTYRAHIIRKLYRKISAANSEADQLQRSIQLQETVDAVRSDERARLRMNEALMALLLRLDSVPGIDPTLRDARRKVSHRIVGLQGELEAVLKQNSVESDALTSAMNEIQQLKVQLEMVAESEATQTKQVELANAELHSLKGNLAETLSLVENMKKQLQDCRESEAQAEAMVMETLLQLETAKKTVEVLGSDRLKAIEAYNSIALELDQSRARANLLEGLVRKLEADLKNASGDLYQNPSVEHSLELELLRTQEMREYMKINAELHSLKPEVARLRSALESAETKYHEEQIRSTVQIRSAYELMEQIKSGSNLREAELEAELKNTKADVEELKSNLMDKETELQGVLEENEGLNSKLEKNLSYQKEYVLEKDLKKSNEHIAELRANLMDKETELQSIMEENEMMKLEINKREMSSRANVNDEVIAEVEAAKSAEREALVKLGVVMGEADKSNRRAAMVTEQLEAAQSANSEMQGELRRLKVQSDQWRKAAEAAATMLSAGNNGKVMERTGSLDSNYNLVAGKFSSPYSEEAEDDLLKKKNINMLKKIGVLWKKPQK